MKKTNFRKILSVTVCIVLIAAIALFTIGCADNNKTDVSSKAESSIFASSEVKELGNGATAFSFFVTDADGKETRFKINTDKHTVGEALLELNLIAGEEGPYGLYIKTVNGTTVDYEKDGGKYWAFYVNGQYASAGVDQTEINPEHIYSFKVE